MKNWKRTEEERAIHKEAVRLRKMTDTQLVEAFQTATAPTVTDRRLETLIEELEAGAVKRIASGTVFKIAAYAKERGLLA